MRRTREEALETRDRILDCAELAFFAQGVAETSLLDIASAAGVTRGAIYGHFTNKTEVFNAVVARVKLPMDALFEAANHPAAADPIAMLRDALSACMRDMAADARTARVFSILLTHRDGAADWLRESQRQSNLEGRERIADALRNAVRRKQLPADLEIARAAALLMAALVGVLHDWLIAPGALSLPDEAERIADALLDMLRLSPALRKKAG